MCGEVQVPEEHLDVSIVTQCVMNSFENQIVSISVSRIYLRYVAYAMPLVKTVVYKKVPKLVMVLRMLTLCFMYRLGKQNVATKV